MLQYIIWTVTPEIIPNTTFPVWYGPLFASGFVMGYIIISKIFHLEGKPEKDLDYLLGYMAIATILGARLGHCLFYEPAEYLSNPIKILYVWEGGLASHGAAIGIILGLYLYARKRPDQSFLWIIDRVVIVVALGGAMIRFGNLMNHEIIGKPSNQAQAFLFTNSLRTTVKAMDKDFSHLQLTRNSQKKDTIVNNITYKPLQLKIYFKGAFNEERAGFFSASLPNQTQKAEELSKHFRIFQAKQAISKKEDAYQVLEMDIYGIPRHPAQLYEAISCLLLFGFLWWLYNRKKEKTPEGQLFAIFLIVLFSLRILYEFLKENQVDFENNLPLNMGQILSIPAILFGIYILLKKKK